MALAAVAIVLAFVSMWLLFSIIAYSFIYGSFIFSYLVLWDDETRHAICPHGLCRAIFYDE